MSLLTSVGDAVFRLQWKPNRMVVNQFKKVFAGNHQAVTDVMQRAESDIYNYWKNNVYTYFNARESAGLYNTGQLGRSLLIKIRGTRMEFYMIPMHNPRTKVTTFFRMPTMSGAMSFGGLSMPSMGMGITKDYDYGDLLRNGFGPSNQGRYSYKYDCKINPGSHPGYDAATRWIPWKENFGGTAKQMLADMMMDEIEKAGVTPKGRWKVDIYI
jgi:hypothetical protein